MFASLFSYLNENRSFDAKPRVRKNRVDVCKDKEDQKLLQPKPMKSKVKKKVSFETKPLVYENEKNSCHVKDGVGFEIEEKKAALKVKILMTKEEAARLIAKCKDGGRLEFKDVASELVQIPINRVNLVSSKDHCLIESFDHKKL